MSLDLTTSIKPFVTATDRDHLWWLKHSGVRLPVRVHVDLGCGGGGLGRTLVDQGVETSVGVDVVMKPQLTEKTDINGFMFVNIDLNRPDWPEQIRQSIEGRHADLVTAFDFLEHVDSPWNTLQAVSRVLAPGGRLVITTPNVMSWERIFKPSKWSGAQDPQHKILLHPYSLKFLLERAGYRLEMLRAPLRKLGPLGWRLPVGGQMIAVAQRGI
jgi:2-polyprenyl-3-methyl-5-hydroxy-6-metoxy-1,4-benzoquinol methylase